MTMDEDIILITNNRQLIELYEDELSIVSNVTLALEYMDNCKFLIVDEDQLNIEEEIFERLIPYKEKVLMLGNNDYADFITINNREFNLDSIDLDISETDSDTTIVKSEINSELDSWLEDYVCDNVSLEELSKTLLKSDKSLRYKFYYYVNVLENKKILNLPIYNLVRIEYTIYSLKEYLKNK